MTEIKEAGTQPVIVAGHSCPKCQTNKCKCNKTVEGTTDSCC